LVTVAGDPGRIVSLVPSLTETLFTLGLGSRVVGVTDLVIADLEENRETDTRRLRARGVPVWVDFPCNVTDVLDRVRRPASLGAPAGRARDLLASTESAARAATRQRDAPRRCLIAVWQDPRMTVSAATYAHDLLAHPGLANVFAEAPERYPPVTAAEIIADDPEVRLLPDEPYAFSARHARQAADDFRTTTAAGRGAIHLVEGTLAFGHGP